MRLKSIKLAGFKSFVDATTVQFPTNLSAVVGPNGCGKSNVIDAVRWVMGESSAKNLRGESMTDVIFNGSSSRQPAGQASIELVFDNSDHTIQGEWNQFSEVAIKRKVTRDAQNTYYINGTKCRRKDITDIFLGTGLGPRSYAIIEQGMISRLIEAKPDELRIFIEEAAGISKYKERRRDTENRIRRTRENLERLTDIRDELGRQLERLARQAASAEKYRAWRKDERELKHKVIAHKWLQLDLSRSNYDQKIQNHECEIDRLKSNRMASSSKIDALKTLSEEQKSVFDEVQAKYFQMGAEIARLQQASQHAESRRREINEEINDLQRRILSASDRTHADKMRIEEAR
ncbi:MAG: AAA family ATPase, partial [Gammaproteobacteria bacterium]|nr:AAA family ATPase [Gammaproteobacteria bacterium]